MLDGILNSIQFTQRFYDERAAQWQQVQGTSKYISATYDAIGSMVADSWARRNTSQDIISQKYSDSTLGYERIYDKSMGETYKAYGGFMDSYSGDRYDYATDDQYAQAISGYIER